MGEVFLKQLFLFVLSVAVIIGLFLAVGIAGNNVSFNIVQKNNNDIITSFVVHPGYPSFSSPESGFVFNNNTKLLTVTDTAVYKTGYYSINGGQWTSFTLSGTAYGNSTVWLTGTATKTLPNFGTGEHYIIIYSCKYVSSSASWDCYGNRWQLLVINNPPAVVPPVATCSDGSQNQGETGVDCGGPCSACSVPTNYLRTFYVSSSSGNDANSGTSSSSPWKTISKVNSQTFKAGDGILFKRGDTWREQLTVPSSGSSSNPITFGAYGTGASPVITGSNIVTGWTSEVVGSFTAYKKSVSAQPTIVYQDNTRLAEVSSKSALTQGTFYWDSANSLVYVRTSGNDDVSKYTMNVGYRNRILDTNNKIYLTFDGITFKHGNSNNQPIRVGSATVTGIVFRNCIFEQNRGSGINLVGTSAANNFIVDNCIIADNGRFGIVVEYEYTTGIISNNQILSNGWASLQEDMQISGIQGALGNLDIYGNTIYNSAPGVANDGSMSHGIYISTPTAAVTNIHDNVIYGNNNGAGIKARYSANIYRNLIYGNARSGVAIGGNDATPVTYNITYNIMHGSTVGTGSGIFNGLGGTVRIIYENNVFYKDGTDALELSIQNNVPYLTIKNNIFYAKDGRRGIDMVQQTGNVDIDNNIYWQDTQSGNPNFKYNNGYPTWAQWQALGFDTHGINTNPLFVDTADLNFHLKSNSPAINKGANVGLTKDFDGNSLVGLPDIGAYENK